MSQRILRIFTMIVMGITTFCILIGGTYFYQKFIYTNPLEKAVSKIGGVGLFQVEQEKDRLLINVQFNAQEKIRPNFYFLLDQLEGQKKSNLSNVSIKIQNPSNEKLGNFLKTVKLPIYEAISTGQFTKLTDQLTALSETEQVTYELEMDNQFIFITANKGGVFAHMVINRGDSAFKLITMMGEEYL